VLVGPVRLRQDDGAAHGRGLEEITDGDVSIGGRVVNDLDAEGARHRDGLPELRALPAHDVAENIAFGLRLRKSRRT
jgi:ABC-type sugar transport system ATPase subunit